MYERHRLEEDSFIMAVLFSIIQFCFFFLKHSGTAFCESPYQNEAGLRFESL